MNLNGDILGRKPQGKQTRRNGDDYVYRHIWGHLQEEGFLFVKYEI